MSLWRTVLLDESLADCPEALHSQMAAMLTAGDEALIMEGLMNSKGDTDQRSGSRPCRSKEEL